MGEADCSTGVLSTMSESSYSLVLCIVVIWPLLLAIPSLYSRLPWPRHLAVMPATLLIIFPADASVEMPRILFGTGFTLDAEVRWILAMSIVVWLLAATAMQSLKHKVAINRATPFFLITLAGSLGVILTSDLVGFFTFSTLMGYGFYGLLLQRCNDELRRIGRLYLMLLVIADLLLFEALLLAASTTGDLHFESVHEATLASSSSHLYMWMVFIGFTFKAGIWPTHLWLTATFRTASLFTTMLLGSVPVAMGLLGMIRWLPLGEHAYSNLGMTMQIIGIISILYMLVRLVINRSLQTLPAWVSVAFTGSFLIALGSGLSNPAMWNQYQHFSYPAIATLGIFMAVLSFTIYWLRDIRISSDNIVQQPKILSLLSGQWLKMIQSRAGDKSIGMQSRWCIPLLKALIRQQHVLDWQKPRGNTAAWSIRITIFVLFILILAWLAG
jgi:formate hydrogenlyase subunit 3/multisubunit Na+/H+ antiporter MnhD subunit